MIGNEDDEAASVARLVQELQASFASLASPPSDTSDYLHMVVARVDGHVRIQMRRERNHARPHFHAKAADECDVSVDIATTEILAGDCRRHWKAVQRWAYRERERLLGLWKALHEDGAVDFQVGA
jgi:hypothetical protein